LFSFIFDSFIFEIKDYQIIFFFTNFKVTFENLNTTQKIFLYQFCKKDSGHPLAQASRNDEQNNPNVLIKLEKNNSEIATLANSLAMTNTIDN